LERPYFSLFYPLLDGPFDDDDDNDDDDNDNDDNEFTTR
jgi:hypothetical protein